MNDLLQGVNIYLIGMMGCGKTTVGHILAQKLGYRFFDSDILIEKVAGKTINEIFATEGEEYFRDLESAVLRELCAYTRSAIATGGGIILRSQNWSCLHHGLIVWLDAPIELLTQRLEKDNTRPLLQKTELTQKLTRILAQRLPIYQQADLHIPIEIEQTPEQITTKIIQMIPTVVKNKDSLTI